MLRDAGEVGCAHCTKLEADRACIVCKRMVCPACAADWTTCDAPSGRLVRLGLTARVRDVDPSGRLALVSHWRQPLRLFDLRQLRWQPDEIPRGIYLFSRPFPPRLTYDGRLLYAEIAASSDELSYRGIHERILSTGYDHTLADTYGFDNKPIHGTAVSSSGDRYYYVSETQRVVILVRDKPVVIIEPLPRKVVHSAFIDGAQDILASGSWAEIALHHFDDTTVTQLAHVSTTAQGDVRWIAMAGGRLLAAIETSPSTIEIELRRVSDPFAVGAVERKISVPGPFGVAALSRDGRYFAIATREQLDVYDLDERTSQRFSEHTERINLLRFGADHMLISADTDNRLILRPRIETGYDCALIPAAAVE